MALIILPCVSAEQVYRFSSACTTYGSVPAYTATDGTSTTRAILDPQRHTKTPTRGSCPLISTSGGYSFSVTSVPRASLITSAARQAALLALITDSGISIGISNAPATYMPSRVVIFGASSFVWQKPNLSSVMPNLSARSLVPSAGSNPTERTTRSNSS